MDNDEEVLKEPWEFIDEGPNARSYCGSPEGFEEWFTNLPTEEQKAYMARLDQLSEPREYRG